MLITKETPNHRVTPHFKMWELFSKTPQEPGREFDEHELSDKVIYGLEHIRVTLNAPIRITSTYRPIWYNRRLGSPDTSQHVACTAIDFQFLDPKMLPILQRELVRKHESALFRELRKRGVAGFGLYPTFCHIDARPRGHHADAWGSYSHWDIR